MRLLLAAALTLTLAVPAMADQWRYEDGGTPIAWFDNGEAQFQFACRGGVLTMGFWVKEPEASVAAAAAFSAAIVADPAEDTMPLGNASFAQDMPLVHLDGSSVIVRGPAARQWASIAQNARDTVGVAFVRVKAGGGFEALEANVFSAKGSKSTIAKVLGECG